MENKNLINEFKENFSKQIANYKITELFVMNNELYTTSEYDIPFDLFDILENKALEMVA